MELTAEQKSVDDGKPRAIVTLSIVISSYNTRELLANCLQSIYRNPPQESFEIVVIDDASTDGTSEMIHGRFPAVRLVRNEVNRHYAISNNRGIDHARGQYLMLLNSDTIVLPEALDLMIAFLRTHPKAGAVGCRLLNEDGTTQWSVKSLPGAGSALFGARSFISRMFPNNRFSRNHLLQVGRDVATPLDVVDGYISGAAVMSPRGVVDAVGYLDEHLFYHVDADYSKRIADAGYQNWYLPTATVVHLNHKGGTAANTRVRFRQLLRFELHSYIYYRKHARTPAWSPMQIFVPLGLSAHFMILIAAQACAELVGAVKSLSQPRQNLSGDKTS
jgi:hypothetical protein